MGGKAKSLCLLAFPGLHVHFFFGDFKANQQSLGIKNQKLKAKRNSFPFCTPSKKSKTVGHEKHFLNSIIQLHLCLFNLGRTSSSCLSSGCFRN